MIPTQLRLPEARFIKVHTRAKNPDEGLNWGEKGRTHDDPELAKHIQGGGNAGLLCSSANLLVIDFDSQELQDNIVPKLPSTFTVKSGRGLLHKYFFCDDPQTIKVLDANKNTLADICGKGKQVLIPPSVHPNGTPYTVVDESSIAPITNPIGTILGLR